MAAGKGGGARREETARPQVVRVPTAASDIEAHRHGSRVHSHAHVGRNRHHPPRRRQRLDSPALIADGNHARADSYVSLAVIASAAAVAAGVPIADPLIGLAITVVILRITWESWLTVRRGHPSEDRSRRAEIRRALLVRDGDGRSSRRRNHSYRLKRAPSVPDPAAAVPGAMA